jgi:hypothetical protein
LARQCQFAFVAEAAQAKKKLLKRTAQIAQLAEAPKLSL